MILSCFPGGGSGGHIDAIRAEILPPNVVNGQIVILTDVPSLSINLGYHMPELPAAGDIWVHAVDNGAYPVTIRDGQRTLVITPGLVVQYESGNGWVYRDAYVGVDGVWKLCSTKDRFSALPLEIVCDLIDGGIPLQDFFEVGDTNVMTLTTGEVCPLEIAGFNCDDLADGSGKALVTLGFKRAMETERRWHSSRADIKWENSEIRSVLANTILPTFPNFVRDRIQPVTKKQINSATSSSTTISTVTDSLFLYSIRDLVQTPGTISWVSPTATEEAVNYPLFAASLNRIKAKADLNAIRYSTRTPSNYSSDGRTQVTIETSGAAGVQTSMTVSVGIVPVFCMGRAAG